MQGTEEYTSKTCGSRGIIIHQSGFRCFKKTFNCTSCFDRDDVNEAFKVYYRNTTSVVWKSR